MTLVVSVRAWFDATDPAAVRRWQATRASAAALCTWITVRTTVGLWSEVAQTQVVLFGVTLCFVTAIVIADPVRHDRLASMGAGTMLAVATILLAALTAELPWLQRSLLLLLVFGSFAIRRFGLRAGELAMLTTMAMYFSMSSDVTTSNVGWFSLAALIGVSWLAVWQFVLIPYDPQRALVGAAAAFYGQLGVLVGEANRAITEPRQTDLHRALRRAGATRRVLESQFPGTLAPGGWTPSALSQLQLAMYSAEQGAGQIVDAVAGAEDLDTLPPHIVELIGDALGALQHSLVAGASPEAMQVLAEQAERIRDEVARIRESSPTVSSDRLLRATNLVGGAQRVARSVALARRLAIAAAAGMPATGVNDTAPRPLAAVPPPLVGTRIKVRPTTALGLQAFVATALAMLVGHLLEVDKVTWVYWSAFLVIAGSAGESLRRILWRIIGTTSGAVIGVVLSLMLPDRTVVVVAVVTAGLFATIFIAPVSYPLMVCFMNIGFVVGFTQLGAREMDLLVDRPLTTLLGGVVAAFVTVAVVPIRVTERFRRALGTYLGLVASATERTVAHATGGPADALQRDAAWTKANTLYRTMEQSMTAVVYESNPFARTETPLASRAVEVAAVDAACSRVLTAADSHDESRPGSDAAATVEALGGVIAQDVAALQRVLGGSSATMGSPTARPERDTLSWALVALHRSLVQLGRGLGATRQKGSS